MSVVMRQVSWGEALVVAAFKEPRGLVGAVERIHRAVGDYIGTRNTFAKLLRVSDPARLEDRDKLRAWLLIAAFGEDPRDWGIPDTVVPPSMDPAQLRIVVRHQGLEPRTRWLVSVPPIEHGAVAIDIDAHRRPAA